MLKNFYILTILIVVVKCDEKEVNDSLSKWSRDKYGQHHHDIYYGGDYFLKYLAFFAIKLKIVFVIATVFTVLLIGAKIMGLIFYLKTKDKEVECVTEKVIYASHPHHHHPISYHHHSPHAYNEEDHHDHEDHEPSGTYQERYGTINKYVRKGRSIRSVDEKTDKIMDFIKRFDETGEVTETTLNILNLRSDVCRKRFVCEVHHLAKSNNFVAFALELLSITKLSQYKENETVTSLEECETKYPNCHLGKVS